ncbi:Gm29797 [Phodopus roborovskii]|uniref:Gm29797 protein n=1 Tax=Phodopus roborovskii TaxID=109678 RepID=A0AAU9YMP6_PHORO|nr:Gm29797 [Phodopus roborovskii]
MVPLKPTVYLLPLLLAFLESALGWAGSQSCSVQEVLRHYQAVIFQDLQVAMQWAGMGAQRTEPGSRHHHFVQKNLTGAGGGQGQPGASCDAQKVWVGNPSYTYLFLPRAPHPTPCPGFRPLPPQEHSILLSIESLGQTLLGSMAGVPHNALEKAAWTVAIRTKAVMHRHCRISSRILQSKKRPVQQRPSRRRLLLRALYAVATCWEKLFALSAVATSEL